MVVVVDDDDDGTHRGSLHIVVSHDTWDDPTWRRTREKMRMIDPFDLQQFVPWKMIYCRDDSVTVDLANSDYSLGWNVKW